MGEVGKPQAVGGKPDCLYQVSYFFLILGYGQQRSVVLGKRLQLKLVQVGNLDVNLLQISQMSILVYVGIVSFSFDL